MPAAVSPADSLRCPMRLELTGRKFDITPALRCLVERKLAKLEQLLDYRALSAQVVLAPGKRFLRADITLHARGEKFLHGVGEASEWEAALSQAAEKIEQQAQKVKGKWQDRKRGGRGRANHRECLAAIERRHANLVVIPTERCVGGSSAQRSAKGKEARLRG